MEETVQPEDGLTLDKVKAMTEAEINENWDAVAEFMSKTAA